MFLLIAVIMVAAVWRTFKLRKGPTFLRGLIAASVVVLGPRRRRFWPAGAVHRRLLRFPPRLPVQLRPALRLLTS